MRNSRAALLAGDLSGLKSHTKERFESNKAWAHLCTKIHNLSLLLLESSKIGKQNISSPQYLHTDILVPIY